MRSTRPVLIKQTGEDRRAKQQIWQECEAVGLPPEILVGLQRQCQQIVTAVWDTRIVDIVGTEIYDTTRLVCNYPQQSNLVDSQVVDIVAV